MENGPLQQWKHRQGHPGHRLDLRRRVRRRAPAGDLQRSAREVERTVHGETIRRRSPARCSSTSAAAASAPSPSARPTACAAAWTVDDTGRRSRCRSATRRSAASSTCWASRSTAAARSTPRHAADPPRAARVRRAVAQDRGVRDRHQGHRPAHARSSAAARPACSAVPASARRSFIQELIARIASCTAATRCSPASASAPAKATTSGWKCRKPKIGNTGKQRHRPDRSWCSAR